jgi:hypothetical protein
LCPYYRLILTPNLCKGKAETYNSQRIYFLFQIPDQKEKKKGGVFSFLFAVLEIELRALHMVGK